jgi:hypothetical protein
MDMSGNPCKRVQCESILTVAGRSVKQPTSARSLFSTETLASAQVRAAGAFLPERRTIADTP